MIKQLFILSLILSFTPSISANKVYDTLYINRDTVNQASYIMEYCCFNQTPNFDRINAQIHLELNDTLNVMIVNRDSMPHTFTIDNVINVNNTILPNDSSVLSFTFSSEGTFRYYSDVSYGKYLGASGNILVGYQNYSCFYWNLFDCEQSKSDSIAKGLLTMIDKSYLPEVFTINNSIYPNTVLDTTASITGNVGDSIIISIVNSGNMIHPLHFHGYHVKILDSKLNPQLINWEKDTFPLFLGDGMTILLTPDQSGLFPVHDHNLINVTTGGYPGGMITLLNIQP